MSNPENFDHLLLSKDRVPIRLACCHPNRSASTGEHIIYVVLLIANVEVIGSNTGFYVAMMIYLQFFIKWSDEAVIGNAMSLILKTSLRTSVIEISVSVTDINLLINPAGRIFD